MPVGNLYGALNVYDTSRISLTHSRYYWRMDKLDVFALSLTRLSSACVRLDKLCKSCALHVTTQFFSVWQYSEIALILETQSRQLEECSAATPSSFYLKFIRRGWTASTEHRFVALHVHDLKKKKNTPFLCMCSCLHAYFTRDRNGDSSDGGRRTSGIGCRARSRDCPKR